MRVAPCEGVRLPERASPEGEVVVVDAGPADRLDLDWLLAVPAQVSHRSLRGRRGGRRSWLASPRSGPVAVPQTRSASGQHRPPPPPGSHRQANLAWRDAWSICPQR